MTIKIDSSILEIFLPENTLEWFDLVQAKQDENNIRIILEEKNIPPIPDKHKNKKIISKGFYDITITDFPIRGKRSLLTFRRRRWQIQEEKEFANSLKED